MLLCFPTGAGISLLLNHNLQGGHEVPRSCFSNFRSTPGEICREGWCQDIGGPHSNTHTGWPKSLMPQQSCSNFKCRCQFWLCHAFSASRCRKNRLKYETFTSLRENWYSGGKSKYPGAVFFFDERSPEGKSGNSCFSAEKAMGAGGTAQLTVIGNGLLLCSRDTRSACKRTFHVSGAQTLRCFRMQREIRYQSTWCQIPTRNSIAEVWPLNLWHK